MKDPTTHSNSQTKLRKGISYLISLSEGMANGALIEATH